MAGILAQGTSVSVGGVIAQVTGISGPSVKPEKVDITTLDSEGGYREFLVGLLDPGELKIDLNLTSEHLSMLETMKGREAQSCSITFPEGGGSMSFSGYVGGLEVTARVGDKVAASLTVIISGEVSA